ncbi:MAG: dihydroorotase [Bacteroidota bacterium]
MQLIIRQATIADPRSSLNGKLTDLYIDNGKVSFQSNSDDGTNATIIDIPGLCVSPAFTDVFAHFCDPGLEFKESLETGTAAALAGGYARVLVLPNTKPPIDAKSQVEYIVQKSKALPVSVLPIGAVTKGCEGKELAEMYDMYASGAVAFSDGLHPVQSGQLMVKALQYVKAFDGVVIQVPDELSITKQGLMNEGIISTQMGLPGKPAIGEYLMVSRDIELARYTESRIHFSGVSTAASFQIIMAAKKEGLQVTCSVTPYHLNFCDEDLQQYDTNLKVNPPLRTRADMEATKKAVLDGIVDCISSHHLPHEYDSKVCEFEYAKYGMEGLESCFGAVRKALPSLSTDAIAKLFAIAPAAIFNQELPVITEGADALLTLFVPHGEQVFQKEQISSLSSNNAFIGQSLTGRIIGVVQGKQIKIIAQ